MSFRAKSEVLDPDKVMLRLTITAPVGEWREVMRALPSVWPSLDLATAIAGSIGDTVGRIDSYSPTPPEAP